MTKSCDPHDRALKAHFLGPQAENQEWLRHEWARVLAHWLGWRTALFPGDGQAVSPDDRQQPLFLEEQDRMSRTLQELLGALDREAPKFTPRYLGHMTTEPALSALLGHVAALLHNPNQTSSEVSRATGAVETQAIADLAVMTGLGPEARGHFTSGGTLANLEFLWRAGYRLDRTLALALLLFRRGELPASFFTRVPVLPWEWFDAKRAEAGATPEELAEFSLLALGQAAFAARYRELTGAEFRAPLLLAPASRHYSWPKLTSLLGWGTQQLRDVPLDEFGRLSLPAFRDALAEADREGRALLGCVTVAGSTGHGAVDRIDLVQDLLDRHAPSAWHHVDAAYGGYFCSTLGGPEATSLAEGTRSALAAMSRVTSLTIDPHKLGFVPFACGAFLARNETHYRSASFAAPYLAADQAGAWLHTVEGSRPGTGAAACWMANRSIGLGPEGYGRILEMARLAALDLADALAGERASLLVLGPIDLNIVLFSLARDGEPVSRTNARTEAAYAEFLRSPNFAVSRNEISSEKMRALLERCLGPRGITIDAPALTCLRIVVMNPFFGTRETRVRYRDAFLDELRAIVARVG